ncbi:MAG: hypothetical protein OXL97_03780 [Chloroflexota bacterium]|nr:hypothetical protein [Chloroflexota bacterium]MDE2886324.1 hypothetical protein [Chloroflexota bacterium]
MEPNSSTEWNEYAAEHYSICYTTEYANDVESVDEWMEYAINLMKDKYGITQLIEPEASRSGSFPLASEQIPLVTSIMLLPGPNDMADTGNTRFMLFAYGGFYRGDQWVRDAGMAAIPYLTPSHSDWDARPAWGVMRLPPDDFHAKNLVHEFTHAIQHSILGYDDSVPVWVTEGLAEYEGMFNSTEYNKTVGFDSLVRYVHDRIPDQLRCCRVPGISIPTFDTTDIYFGGALIMKYLADTFGEDIHVRLMHHSHPTFAEALAAELETAGTTVPETFEDLQRWLQQKYRDL